MSLIEKWSVNIKPSKSSISTLAKNDESKTDINKNKYIHNLGKRCNPNLTLRNSMLYSSKNLNVKSPGISTTNDYLAINNVNTVLNTYERYNKNINYLKKMRISDTKNAFLSDRSLDAPYPRFN